MNSKSTNPLMKQKFKEENMSVMMGLILPIVVVVITYTKAQYDRKRQMQDYNQIVSKVAKDIVAQIKSLPKGE